MFSCHFTQWIRCHLPTRLHRLKSISQPHRLAVFHELEKGIDNHFTVAVPGIEDRYLVLPFGLHWFEACVSNMITFNEASQTLDGDGIVELSAHCIHAPTHRITGVRAALHTQQTKAIALNRLENNQLVPASQTAAFFEGIIACENKYRSTADTLEDGGHLSHLLGDKSVMFLKNQGVFVAADSISQA